MSIIEDTLLAKHFIKKGKEITSEDLCYLDSGSAEIKSIEYCDSSFLSVYSIVAKSNIIAVSPVVDLSIHPTEIANLVVGKCATENIEMYQPIDIDKLESTEVKEQRETKQSKAKKLRETKQSMEEKIQQKKEGNDSEKSNLDEPEDSLKNEITDNIWL